MVDVKGKYPDLVTITNKNVATSYRYNDDIQEALVSGLLDSSKTSWTEVLK